MQIYILCPLGHWHLHNTSILAPNFMAMRLPEHKCSSED
uniref:Uncharacterized protein n=1 Tax=Arundo donax TaxID=35708 RepID=A0A0A9GJI6_ARUDO